MFRDPLQTQPDQTTADHEGTSVLTARKLSNISLSPWPKVLVIARFKNFSVIA